MRAGGCTLQQALTPEATAVVKQAVSLARRRGHAQVTPLHVASTMLSSPTGLLRAACLQSHSHPLQCKALELCFNVALNRLPASSSPGPMLAHHHAHHHHHPPSLSNALVAAFKRAQAHQRRGSVESQQQPLLAVKIEVEQLVISILDDPSVSRVMREAGFSSTQVKSNVEQAVSLEMCTSSPNANPSKPKEGNQNGLSSSAPVPQAVLKTCRPPDQSRISEDVTSVVDSMVSKRKRSVVIVGESLASTEEVAKGLMDKVDRGEVPEVFRTVQFISLPLFSFSHLSREEVDQKVGELRCLVKSCSVGRGAVLYLGDLKWAAEYWASCGEKGSSYYCPVEHIIMELGRLVCGGIGEGSFGGRFWFMGVATYSTYMRCRAGRPSLETLWGLYPVAIPAGSLGLSLSHDSYLKNPMRSKKSGDGSYWFLRDDVVSDNTLGCCADCSTKSDDATQPLLPPTTASPKQGAVTSFLPSWLQEIKDNAKIASSNNQDCLRSRDQMGWSNTCNSNHKVHHPYPDKTLNFVSTSPSLASRPSYHDHYSSLSQTHKDWPLPVKHPWKEHLFVDDHHNHPAVSSQERKKPTTSPLVPQSKPGTNSTSSGTMETGEHRHDISFKELNAENLKVLCGALEKKVPWRMDVISEIASTILRCRSGMVRRRGRSSSSSTKEDTWLFFLGCDVDGKEKIARELATLVFGSHTSFVSVGLSNFSPTKSDSSDGPSSKRPRSEGGCSYFERFVEAVKSNAHGVFLLEDMEQVDRHSQVSIKRAIESGRLNTSNGEEVPLEDAIVILSCESFDCRSRACSPPIEQKSESEGEEKEEVDREESSSYFSFDLNISAGDADDQVESSQPFDEVGLLDSVDRSFLFRRRDDL